MIDHAEREFALQARDEKGHSLRETLEGLRDRARSDERRAEIEAELAVPPIPAGATYLWSAFLRIRRRRAGGFGPSPIEWADIDAFIRLTGIRLLAWEVEIIEALDDVWLREVRTEKSNRP